MCAMRNSNDAVKYRRYVEILAEEAELPIEDVRPVYDDVTTELRALAQVTDFIPIFAWRRTRERLVRR